MSEPEVVDRPYAEATRRALGEAIADVFLGMFAKGVSREEALRLTEAWIWAQFSPKPDIDQ